MTDFKTATPLPSPEVSPLTPNGKWFPGFYAWLRSVDELVRSFRGTFPEQIDGLTVEHWSWHIPFPVNGDIRLIVNIPVGYTITNVTTRCVSGTCTATWKINTTALGGSANSVSSSEQSRAHSTNNVMVPGDDFVLTISSASSPVGMVATARVVKALG